MEGRRGPGRTRSACGRRGLVRRETASRRFSFGRAAFYGPELDIIAETVVAAAAAVWKPTLSWTMPLDELEHELRTRDGQCVVLADFDAASLEQINAVLTACNAVRLAVVSWGAGSVSAKVGLDRALDLAAHEGPPSRIQSKRAHT